MRGYMRRSCENPSFRAVYGKTREANLLSSSSQSVSAVNPEAVSEKTCTLAAVCKWVGDVRRDVQDAHWDSFALSL